MPDPVRIASARGSQRSWSKRPDRGKSTGFIAGTPCRTSACFQVRVGVKKAMQFSLASNSTGDHVMRSSLVAANTVLSPKYIQYLPASLTAISWSPYRWQTMQPALLHWLPY